MTIRRRKTLAFVAVALALSACNRANQTEARPSTGTPSVSSATRTATLERTSCYGTCPVYKVTLQSDGNVRYEGVRNVRVSGVRTWRVPLESATVVFRFADSARFADLNARYDFGDAGCAPFIAELPGFGVALASGGATKRVDANQGCASIPRALTALASLIDRVTRTDSTLTGRP